MRGTNAPANTAPPISRPGDDVVAETEAWATNGPLTSGTRVNEPFVLRLPPRYTSRATNWPRALRSSKASVPEF